MKKCVLLLFVSFFAGQISSYCQDMIVEGKSYAISSTRQINSDVEYLLLKEKTVRVAKNESFIRVNKVVSKTTFGEAEIKKFLTNGNISSLGKLVEKEISIRGRKINLQYIQKGTLQILFHIENDKVKFKEFNIDLEDHFKESTSKKKADPANEAYASCRYGCIDDLVACSVDHAACNWLYEECMQVCEDALFNSGHSGKPRSPKSYFLPIKNLTILVK